MQMGGYIHQQLLLATGRTHHQLAQSVDCVHRQLMLRAEHARNQSPQVEGRIHRELLQMSGRVQYQLLMAAECTRSHAATDGGSPPATMGSKMFSPPTNADNGQQEATFQHGGGGCPDIASHQ